MRSPFLLALLSVLMFPTMGFAQGTHQIVYTSIDAPGASATTAYGINSGGVIVGTYSKANDSVGHGFLLRNGRFTTLDVPGASSTAPESVNDNDDVAGDYTLDGESFHGFLLTAAGQLTTLDFPGAGGIGTFAIGVNLAGTVVGRWIDNAAQQHGFIWSGGTFTNYDFPHSLQTQLSGINTSGIIVGSEDDQSDGMRRPVSDGMLYAPKLSTCSKHKR